VGLHAMFLMCAKVQQRLWSSSSELWLLCAHPRALEAAVQPFGCTLLGTPTRRAAPEALDLQQLHLAGNSSCIDCCGVAATCAWSSTRWRLTCPWPTVDILCVPMLSAAVSTSDTKQSPFECDR
jgi:hypothetical protein